MIPRFKPRIGWRELLAVLRSNQGTVKKFEKEFATKFHAVDAVAFPYGRSAQWAFLKSIGIKDAEIIMPAYTCSVVAHAVTLSGNIPRFIDIDLDDYNMNLDLAESAINENTRAVIATHTFGYPQDLDRLNLMVREAEKRFGHKVWLINDCCHAFGAKWKGKTIGTSGDVGVYAFNVSKLMTTIFGGMLTFQNHDLALKVRKWRDENYQEPSFSKKVRRIIYLIAIYFAFNESIYGFVWKLQKSTTILDRFTKTYHLDDKIEFPPDFLDKMLDLEAAVGLVQLSKYDEIIHTRREKALYYDSNRTDAGDWVYPPIVEGATYSHYPVRVTDKKKIIMEFEKKGVELGELIQYAIPVLQSYRSQSEYSDSFENSVTASERTINLPISH